jgi:hypothetical protein
MLLCGDRINNAIVHDANASALRRRRSAVRVRRELNEHVTWLSVGALMLILTVVAFMLYRVLDGMRVSPWRRAPGRA